MFDERRIYKTSVHFLLNNEEVGCVLNYLHHLHLIGHVRIQPKSSTFNSIERRPYPVMQHGKSQTFKTHQLRSLTSNEERAEAHQASVPDLQCYRSASMSPVQCPELAGNNLPTSDSPSAIPFTSNYMRTPILGTN